MATVSAKIPAPFSLYYKLPASVRQIVPPWYVVGIAGLLVSFVLKNGFLFEMSGVFCYGMLLNYSIYKSANLSKAVSKMPWLLGMIYAPLAALISMPVFAQATGGGGECSGGGIFGPIVAFVSRTLSTLTLQGGNSVSTYVCQMISILVVVVIMGFLAAIGTAGFAAATNRDFSAMTTPLAAIMGTVVLVTVVITAFIGN